METFFNYDEVPFNYTHCLMEQCPRSADCLRFLVTRHVPRQTVTIQTVNPLHLEDKETCPFFHPDCLSRFAVGFSNILNNLPHEKAILIRKDLIEYFGRVMYYRIRNKERQIRPEEQLAIDRILKDRGILEKPVFDEYIDRYDFSNN